MVAYPPRGFSPWDDELQAYVDDIPRSQLADEDSQFASDLSIIFSKNAQTSIAKRVNAYKGNPALGVNEVVMDTPPSVVIAESVPTPRLVETFLVSDGFSGSGELSGRNADNALGGAATIPWQTTAVSRFAVSGGSLVQVGTSAAVAGLAMSTPNYHVSGIVKTLPVGTLMTLMGRRTLISGGTSVALLVAPSGVLTGSGIVLPATTIVAGDRIGLRFMGVTVEALVNGVVIASGTTTLAAPGFAGITYSASTTIEVEDFWVKTNTVEVLPSTTGLVTKRKGRYASQTLNSHVYQQNQSNNPSTVRAPSALEFNYQGDGFDVKFYNALPGSAGLRVIVDGQVVQVDPFLTSGGSTAGGIEWATVTFATSARRNIVLEFCGGAIFGALSVDSGDAVTPIRDRPPRSAIFGDSWVGGAGGVLDNKLLYSILGRELGWEVARFGQGGSGYDQAGSGAGVAYGNATRVSELAQYNPDFGVVIGSINDNGHVAEVVGANAAAFYAAVAAASPQTRLIVVGPQFADWTSPASTLANRDAIKAAALSAQNVVAFIDPIAAQWLTPANKTTYMIDESGTYQHLNEAGHLYWARKLAIEIVRVGTSAALPIE